MRSSRKKVTMRKCILYYTCCTHSIDIEMACRKQLQAARGECELLSVSLNPIKFGDGNIVLDHRRSPETMHWQILVGLEHINADCVFLCESDVLYHQSHFEIELAKTDRFYYNTNVWRLRYEDGLAVWTDDLQQVSGVCADYELLLEFYQRRVKQIELEGFNRHYEPGPKTGPYQTENWQSEVCNIDIRHNKTLTRSKWSPSEFRNKKYAKGWQTTRNIPGWGDTQNILKYIKRNSHTPLLNGEEGYKEFVT